MPDRLTDDITEDLRLLADDLTRVRPQECLFCYLLRMLEAFDCTGGSHRWTERWIESQPRTTGWVLGWVKRNGGCCCDCEVVMNVFDGRRTTQRHAQLRCAASYRADDYVANHETSSE